MFLPALAAASLALLFIVAAVDILDPARIAPEPQFVPCPTSQHSVMSSILAKKAADKALADAQAACTIANTGLKIDLLANGSAVWFVPDPAHPSTIEVWKVDSFAQSGVTSLIAVQADSACVPGPDPILPEPPPTADNLAMLAQLKRRIDSIDVNPGTPPTPNP